MAFGDDVFGNYLSLFGHDPQNWNERKPNGVIVLSWSQHVGAITTSNVDCSPVLNQAAKCSPGKKGEIKKESVATLMLLICESLVVLPHILDFINYFVQLLYQLCRKLLIKHLFSAIILSSLCCFDFVLYFLPISFTCVKAKIKLTSYRLACPGLAKLF